VKRVRRVVTAAQRPSPDSATPSMPAELTCAWSDGVAVSSAVGAARGRAHVGHEEVEAGQPLQAAAGSVPS
jgi:hypothetical protein